MSNSGITGLASGGGAVTSIFTRSGNVVAANGDYTSGQVTEPHVAVNYAPGAANVGAHIAAIDVVLGTFGTGAVSSVYGRSGDVVATFGDYTGALIGEARVAVHYTPTAATVEGHLAGIDAALAGGGGGGVSTVFGRSGTVVAVAGDYGGTLVAETRATAHYTASHPTVEGHLDGLDVAVGAAQATAAAAAAKAANGSDFVDPRAVRGNLGAEIGRNVTPAVDSWSSAPLGTAPPLSSTFAFCRNLTTGQNYFGKAPDTVCTANYAASTAKLCTALLLLREKRSVLVSETATVLAGETVGGTTAGLQVGDVVSLNDLLFGMMVPSGNDAAEVVARVVGTAIRARTGSGTTGRVRFVAEMNLLAAQLGMTNTSFGSPHGIQYTPDGANNSVNTTTARDLAMLAAAALTNATIGNATLALTHLMTITGANARTYTISHTTVWFYPDGVHEGILGSKGGRLTATTHYSLTTLWQAPSGALLVLVTIDSPSNEGDRYLDTTGMFYEAIVQFGLDGRRDTDASFAQVVLLVGGEAGFVDESPVGRTLTNTAATRASAGAIVASSSLVFDGATAHVDAPDAADLSFAAGDWCVEFWWRGRASVPGINAVFVAKWDPTGNQREWLVQWDGSTGLQGGVSLTGSDIPVSIFTLSAFDMAAATLFNGAIRHLLVRRSSTEVAVYLNGIKADTPLAVGASALFSGTSKLMIGARQQGGTGFIQPVPAVIDELRVTKGQARRTAAKFSPIPRMLARS